MTDIEKFWNAISGKFGVNANWSFLTREEQIAIIQAVNMIISVMNSVVKRMSNAKE